MFKTLNWYFRTVCLFMSLSLLLSGQASACVSSRTYTCSQLGMVPYDYNSRSQNTSKLIKAINAGYTIICDNTYFLTRNQGDIKNSIKIKGQGTFILDENLSITHSIMEIVLDGVSFVSYEIYSGKAFDAESPKCVFWFSKTDQHYSMSEIVVKNCHVNNICLVRFPNRTGDHIRKVVIDNNEWHNMSYLGIGIISTTIDNLAITNNKAFKVKSRLFDFSTATNDMVNKAVVSDNYLSNEGYFSNTEELYAGLAVIECQSAVCERNVVENFLVANKRVNLYDIYCNCNSLVYRNNAKYNVINFQDVNLLCKAKSFFGEGGSRKVYDNSFIVDDEVIDSYHSLITPDCSVRLIELSPNENQKQRLLSVKNNYIHAAVPCSFGMMSNTNIEEVVIDNNIIECYTVSSGDYYYRGYANNAIITRNTITPKTKVTTNTPAVSLLKGKYKMEGCNISAFPGAISSDVENVVSNSTLTFAYHSQASPHIALGGSVSDCVINFQGFDLGNNYNVYLEKAKNSLNIHEVKLDNVPKRGIFWLRNILDTNRSSAYVVIRLSNNDEELMLLLDNNQHVIYMGTNAYPVKNDLQSIDARLGSKKMRVLFLEDKVGFEGLDNGVFLSIKEMTETQFKKLL